MSDRVSDERLKVMTREGYRLASGSFVDEEIAAMASELIQRRAEDQPDDAARYESELRRLSEFVQTRHPSGAAKHIGLMESVPAAMELISEASEWIGRHLKDDDAEPITAKWLETVGFYREADYGGDDGWLAKDFDDGTPDWLTVNPEECEVTIINDDGGSVTRDISSRGDLRRLWLALTGSELDERKAGG